jgi:hypothetical protein
MEERLNNTGLKPSGYIMFHQISRSKFCILFTECIYMFCVMSFRLVSGFKRFLILLFFYSKDLVKVSFQT